MTNIRWGILLALAILLAACGSARNEANDWSQRFPTEFGEWELDEDILRLSAADASNYGHVILNYENDDDALVEVTILSYATENIANLELETRMKDWRIRGASFDRIRGGLTFDAVTLPNAQIYVLQEEKTIITLTFLPAPSEDEAEAVALFSEEAIEPWLELIGEIEDNR